MWLHIYVDWLLIFQDVFLPLGILNNRASQSINKYYLPEPLSHYKYEEFPSHCCLVFWLFEFLRQNEISLTSQTYYIHSKAFTIFIEGKCKDIFFCFLTFLRCLFTHFVKVFFWMASRSSVKEKENSHFSLDTKQITVLKMKKR